VGHRDANGFEPQDSFTSMTHFRELRALLEHEYRWDKEIGHFVIFHHEPPAR
jgi:hypothetical protein